MSRMGFVAVLIIASAVLAACSAPPGASDSYDRSMRVTMADDMRYRPDAFDFLAGETIRFTVTNEGQMRHEFFVGNADAHEAHAAEMRGMMDQPMGHDQPGLLTLDPGASGTLDYTFDEAGQLFIGCHEPGHYEAGMVADITVHPAP